MKKIILSLAAAVFLSVFAHAQSSVWKISKGENVLYLGGSVHMLRAEDYPLPREFDAAFEKADTLVFEADLLKAESPEFSLQMVSYMRLPEGKTLKGVLSKEAYAALEKKCAEFGLPIEFVAGFTPFATIAMLEILEIQKLGFIAEGVDLYYTREAKAKGKKLEFLETPEFQMKLFGAGGDVANDLVLQSIAEFDEIQKFMPIIIAEWKEGFAKQLNALHIEDMKTRFPSLYKLLLVDRNKTWLDAFEKYLATKEVEFVIVGLAHIHGSDGLLSEFQKRGYKIEQIK